MMKCVYEAPNGLEARMIADLIEQAGIDCRVDGEFLQGGVGDLFAGDFFRVLVEDEYFAKARQVVDNWQATQVHEVKPEVAKGSKKSSSKFVIFVALAIGLFIGLGGTHSYYNSSETQGGVDHNRDGKLDETWTFLRDKLTKIELDSNFDGQVDEILYYSSQGQVNYAEQDLNFDGKMDTRSKYKNDKMVLRKSDTNGDGIKDLHSYFENDGRYRVEFYHTQTHKLIKVQKFSAFKLESSKFDSNGDGILDKIIYYNEYEEVNE